jgi:hypothetical protein
MGKWAKRLNELQPKLKDQKEKEAKLKELCERARQFQETENPDSTGCALNAEEYFRRDSLINY